MDLGFKFNTTLNPGDHINFVCSKALKTVGFITRLDRDFHLGSSVKSLFCAQVRPIFEYGTVVWVPYAADNSIGRLKGAERCLKGISADINN